MVIYRDVDVIIVRKGYYKKKIKGKVYRGFHKWYSDLPSGRFNEITGKYEVCINTRGYGYALRNALKYKK